MFSGPGQSSMGTERGRSAKKSLGQNFLVDPGVIDRIVGSVDFGSGQTVVEVGAGRGALTRVLAERCDRLIGVEKDDSLAPRLAREFQGNDRVAILHSDALTVLPGEMPFEGPYQVVGNLPYNIGGRITMHLLENWGAQLSSATLMFQREVAERLAAGPESRSYGALSVLVQAFCEVWLLFGVPPEAFRPVPKVNSMVVRLQRRSLPLFDGLDYEFFRRTVHGAFHARRKTVLNSLVLAPGLPGDAELLRSALEQAEISSQLRADAIPIERYLALARVLDEHRSEGPGND